MSLSCKTHRPTQYQQITDGVTYTSSYQYNLSGAMTQETYPSGRVVKNTFDSNGDVARVFGKATPSSVEKTYANSFNYNASGGISAMRLGNGKWETAKFNKRLQVTELGLGHASQDESLWKVNYEFGEFDSNNGLVDTTKNTGNIAKQTVSFNGLPNAFVQTYQYDSLYRLKEANEKAGTTENWKQDFTYDRYGNRLTHNKFINGSQITHNQQTHPSIDASTNRFSDTNQYGYDKAGNLIADNGRTFTFDGNNKQILVTSTSGTVGEYSYDGDGMRVKKHVYTGGNHTKTVIFVYSGGKLAEEYSNDPVTSPKTKYLTEDHLGTPRIITDETGEVVSRRDFMPFGQEIAKTTGTRSDSSFKYSSNEDDVKQKFTGYQQDSETMLDFAEARMYENRHARFTAVDPLLASGNSGNPQTFNRYVYVINSPLIYTDPDGLQVAQPFCIRWCRPAIRGEGKNQVLRVFKAGQKLPKGFRPVTERQEFHGESRRSYWLTATTVLPFNGDTKEKEIVGDRLKIIGYSGEKEKMIKKRVSCMAESAGCTQAFKKARIPTLQDVLLRKGMTIANPMVLKDNESVTIIGDGFTEQGRQIGLDKLPNDDGWILNGTDAFTLNDEEDPDQRSFTFFKEQAFNLNGWFGLYGQPTRLDEAVTHEMVHQSDVRTYGRPPMTLIHNDLTGYPYYENILDNCMCPEENY